MAKVWIDEARCAGCGVCVTACPTHAIKVVDGKARVDLTLCRGCEICVGVCPLGAIEPAVEGEVVEVSTELYTQAARAVQPAKPQAVTRVSVAKPEVRRGAGLLLALDVLQGIAAVADRWLASRRRPMIDREGLVSAALRPASAARGTGRRMRYRRRGRRM